MNGKEKERWRELCEQAGNEYDPQKRHELVAESTAFWKKGRLLQQSISGTDPAG